MLNGHPISAKLPEDLGFGERFWYWRGHSGQSYIHSIYGRDTCPPLPGAVFVAVRNSGGSRRPVSIGRFPASIDGAKLDFTAGRFTMDIGSRRLVARSGYRSFFAEFVVQ